MAAATASAACQQRALACPTVLHGQQALRRPALAPLSQTPRKGRKPIVTRAVASPVKQQPSSPAKGAKGYDISSEEAKDLYRDMVRDMWDAMRGSAMPAEAGAPPLANNCADASGAVSLPALRAGRFWAVSSRRCARRCTIAARCLASCTFTAGRRRSAPVRSSARSLLALSSLPGCCWLLDCGSAAARAHRGAWRPTAAARASGATPAAAARDREEERTSHGSGQSSPDANDVPAGVIKACLRKDDFICSTYRDHVHALSKARLAGAAGRCRTPPGHPLGAAGGNCWGLPGVTAGEAPQPQGGGCMGGARTNPLCSTPP